MFRDFTLDTTTHETTLLFWLVLTLTSSLAQRQPAGWNGFLLANVYYKNKRARSCSKLSPMKIPSTRLVAPGSPKMWYSFETTAGKLLTRPDEKKQNISNNLIFIFSTIIIIIFKKHTSLLFSISRGKTSNPRIKICNLFSIIDSPQMVLKFCSKSGQSL